MNICKFFMDLMLDNLDFGGRNTLTVGDLGGFVCCHTFMVRTYNLTREYCDC